MIDTILQTLISLIFLAGAIFAYFCGKKEDCLSSGECQHRGKS
ncbi:MAG: hypothetical protein PSN35_01625 [Candidatus Thioglobus sp.]|nr:hypothetical protein [Candidatus Thioglobus sp.]MDC9726518.1 hypothetical protein [Candidatus Thioglobus sp.]